MNAPLAFTIEGFTAAYGVGRTKIYEEIKAGRLTTYRLGKRRYISAQAAATWQAGLEAAAKLAKEGAGVPA